ncbi:MAG: hypothetical protein M1820_005691 [Bogoriella megaspora]|nr:MAG: hypothetical protein M1820_005691 [Bogoriella megaspora]
MPSDGGIVTAVVDNFTLTSPTAYYSFEWLTADFTFGNIPGPLYTNQIIPVNSVDVSTITIYDDDYAPYLAIPPQVTELDPAWSSCSPYHHGAFDPPSALQPASSAASPVNIWTSVESPYLQTTKAPVPGSVRNPVPATTVTTIEPYPSPTKVPPDPGSYHNDPYPPQSIKSSNSPHGGSFSSIGQAPKAGSGVDPALRDPQNRHANPGSQTPGVDPEPDSRANSEDPGQAAGGAAAEVLGHSPDRHMGSPGDVIASMFSIPSDTSKATLSGLHRSGPGVGDDEDSVAGNIVAILGDSNSKAWGSDPEFSENSTGPDAGFDSTLKHGPPGDDPAATRSPLKATEALLSLDGTPVTAYEGVDPKGLGKIAVIGHRTLTVGGSALTVGSEVISAAEDGVVLIGVGATETASWDTGLHSFTATEAVVTLGGTQVIAFRKVGPSGLVEAVVGDVTLTAGGPTVVVNGEALSVGGNGILIDEAGTASTSIWQNTALSPSTVAEAVFSLDGELATVLHSKKLTAKAALLS